MTSIEVEEGMKNAHEPPRRDNRIMSNNSIFLRRFQS